MDTSLHQAIAGGHVARGNDEENDRERNEQKVEHLSIIGVAPVRKGSRVHKESVSGESHKEFVKVAAGPGVTGLA
jgi:hypothetical protein